MYLVKTRDKIKKNEGFKVKKKKNDKKKKIDRWGKRKDLRVQCSLHYSIFFLRIGYWLKISSFNLM